MENKREVGIVTRCPICKEQHIVEVNFDDYRRWKKEDTHVQDAFPYLNDVERELLITGICAKCWEKHINLDDDE